jgi:valyl-tRNA synthetase
MMMLGIHLMGDAPFETIYLSGLVRDPYGQKMSKTRGNVVDPLEAIDESGADALRFALIHGAAPGNDQKFSAEKLENARNFANKLWNAARFVRGARPGSIPVGAPRGAPDPRHLGPGERWLRTRVAATVADADRAIAEFAFGELTRVLYDAIWGEYCDWALELAKVRLADETLPEAEREATWWTLVEALDTYLRLLHPVMPFITEAIWGTLPHAADDPQMLIVAAWPRPPESDPVAAGAVGELIELVRGVRNARAEAGLDPAAWLPIDVSLPEDLGGAFASLRPALERLARARPLTIALGGDRRAAGPGALAVVAGRFEASVSTAAAGDVEAHDRERARLDREIGEAERLLEAAEARLSDPRFVERAPAAVVEGARTRAAELGERVGRLRDHRAALG